MGINEILGAFKSFGIGGTILACIILLLWLIIKSTWFANFMTKVSDLIIEKIVKSKNKSREKVIAESDIVNHDIFSYIDFWIYSKIPTFKFSSEYRTVVFRRYLSIFLKTHKDKIKEFIENKEFEKMDDSQLWTSLLKLINDIIYNYEKEMLSVGIPMIIIEKMKVKNNDTISLTIDLIEGVCNSQFYDSDKNYLKIYSILNILLSILENTICNSDLICNSINGQLKGMKFIDNGKEYIEK